MRKDARLSLALGVLDGPGRTSRRIGALLQRGRSFAPGVSWASMALGVVWLLAFATLPMPRWIASAQAPKGPEFDVASVKPSNPEEGMLNAVTPSLNISADRNLRFIHVTLRDLIMLAYDVGAAQIQGPSFLFGTMENPADRFDVVAQVPEGSKKEQVPLMLQALLAERFHLALHKDSKAIEVYALEVGKTAPKFKASPEGSTGTPRCIRSLARQEGATAAADCTHVTSKDIAQQLMALAPGYFRNTPIVDLTGLTGVYDLHVDWITAAEANAGAPGPTMIDAIRDQLGLKMEKRKQTQESLVIDKLDRNPTAN